MARDQSGGATPSAEERAAAERAGRKCLGPDGRPQARPAPGPGAADRGVPDAMGQVAGQRAAGPHGAGIGTGAARASGHPPRRRGRE
jgi:hypothetical protein